MAYKSFVIATLVFAFALALSAQTYQLDMARDSARTDKITGGLIEYADLEKGAGNLTVTLNVPSFVLTVWQNGKEIRRYNVGVGMKDHPIFIGRKRFDQIIFNPSWFAPYSEWVDKNMRGKEIKASDPRNPLGRVKIPIGNGFLLHQAKGRGDLGSLVSHGCIRVMLKDLHELNDLVVAAYDLEVDPKLLKRAKRTKNTLVVKVDEPIPIEITYDTVVIENGKLNVYPDVYEYKRDYEAQIRHELDLHEIDPSEFTSEELTNLYEKVKGKTKFVISMDDVYTGDYSKGKLVRVVGKR